jgi:hypothetical protein
MKSNIEKETYMSKTKLTGILIIAAVLFAQVGTVFAAPQVQDETPITGTVQSIVLETDSEGLTTVVVTVTDDLGETQVVRLSVESALALGLITLDPESGDPAVDETKIGDVVQIDPATVIPDEEPVEESHHIISELLSMFFGEDAGVIDEYHQNGFGFGVIAQSLWISQNVNGDASLAGDILEAKQTGDYSAFFPEGTEDVPTNWGQFKKALSNKKNNLGVVVSGHGNNGDSEEQSLQGNGHGNGQGKDKEKSNNGKGKDKNK